MLQPPAKEYFLCLSSPGILQTVTDKFKEHGFELIEEFPHYFTGCKITIFKAIHFSLTTNFLTYLTSH